MKSCFSEGYTNLISFFEMENLVMSDSMLSKLISFLPKAISYEEEGTKIRPNIIIGNQIDLLFPILTGKYVIEMNRSSVEDFKFEKLIKSFAPFCNNGWTIYFNIDPKNNTISTGIIRMLVGPNGLMLKDTIFDGSDYSSNIDSDGLSLIHIEVENSNEIKLRGINRNTLNLEFRLIQETDNLLDDVIEDLVRDISIDIENGPKKQFNYSMTKLFQLIHKKVHGAICLVVKSDLEETDLLRDGIWFKEPIDIYSKWEEAILKNNPSNDINSYELYYSITGLFIEMLNTDGITIVDTKGRIRAYNVFISSSEQNNAIAGGARKRAAETLVTSSNSNIIGVYFQSQDGGVFYKRRQIHE